MKEQLQDESQRATAYAGDVGVLRQQLQDALASVDRAHLNSINEKERFDSDLLALKVLNAANTATLGKEIEAVEEQLRYATVRDVLRMEPPASTRTHAGLDPYVRLACYSTLNGAGSCMQGKFQSLPATLLSSANRTSGSGERRRWAVQQETIRRTPSPRSISPSPRTVSPSSQRLATRSMSPSPRPVSPPNQRLDAGFRPLATKCESAPTNTKVQSAHYLDA